MMDELLNNNYSIQQQSGCYNPAQLESVDLQYATS